MQPNMNGWIPSSLLSLVARDMPMAVGAVRKYLKDYGKQKAALQGGQRRSVVQDVLALTTPMIGGQACRRASAGAPPVLIAVAGYLEAFSLDSEDAIFTASWKWRNDVAVRTTDVYVSQRRYPGGAEVVLTPSGRHYKVGWDSAKVRPFERHGPGNGYRLASAVKRARRDVARMAACLG